MTEPTNEITEVAKATQEVAKTTSKALDTGEKIGGFISQYIGGSLEQAMGIFEDKLKYIRWERQQRLFLQAQKFTEDEGSKITRPLPIKHAIPLLSAASLEEDDFLQDIWAKLLVNFTIEKSGIEASRVYIDILEQLSSLDVKIMNTIYSNDFEVMHHNGVATRDLPHKAIVLEYKTDDKARECLKIEPSKEVKLALANLDRLGILYIQPSMGGGQFFSLIHPTILGKYFFEACTLSYEK